MSVPVGRNPVQAKAAGDRARAANAPGAWVQQADGSWLNTVSGAVESNDVHVNGVPVTGPVDAYGFPVEPPHGGSNNPFGDGWDFDGNSLGAGASHFLSQIPIVGNVIGKPAENYFNGQRAANGDLTPVGANGLVPGSPEDLAMQARANSPEGQAYSAAHPGFNVGAKNPDQVGIATPPQPPIPPISTGTTSQPLTATPGGAPGAASFDAVNKQNADVMAGVRADYSAGKTPRDVPLAAGGGPTAATHASAGTLPMVGDITASTAAPTTLQRTGAITDTTVDRTQSDQTRGQQQVSLADLRTAAEGRVPSAAELQLRQTTDRNVANQYALAAALQGRSAGGALKQASDAAGDLNAKAVADAAILRATETAAARKAESDALLGVRTGDITVAGKQADITSATKTTNQSADITQNKTTAELDKGNKEFNATATQGAAVQNQNTQVGENKTVYTGEQDISRANAEADTKVAQANADRTQALNISNAKAQLDSRHIDDQAQSVLLTAIMTAQGHAIQGLSAQALAQNMLAAQALARDALNKSTSQADRAYWTALIGSLLQAGAAGYQTFGGGGAGGAAPAFSGNYGSTANGVPIDATGGGYGDYPGDTGTVDEAGNPIGGSGITDGGT